MDRIVLLDDKRYGVREILCRVVVRPVTPNEVPRWKALVRRHHYLGDCLVGKTLLHVAEVDGHWVALLGWSSPALKVGVRDRWLGWTPRQRQRRLTFVAQNARFALLLSKQAVPNLASRVLAQSVRRLASDWQAVHGQPVVLAETFVDPRHFAGTCYRAAGWLYLGDTQGYGKHCMRYELHGEPKQVWVRPLFRGAEGWLRQPFDAPALTPPRKEADLTRIPLDELLAALARVPDGRRRRGIRHRQVSILAMAALAVMAGCRGFRAIADCVAGLEPEILERLGCRRQPRKGTWQPPSEPTIRRMLQRIDVEALDSVVGGFLKRLSGPADAVALDGKVLRGSGRDKQSPRMLLAAVTHKTAVALAQREVPPERNEIAEVKPLLGPLDLRGTVITADALHTQAEPARYLVEEKGADYVFTVKDNWPFLRRLLASQDWSLFPPVHRKG